jgi:type II secretory pathway pseudopilin PulG
MWRQVPAAHRSRPTRRLFSVLQLRGETGGRSSFGVWNAAVDAHCRWRTEVQLSDIVSTRSSASPRGATLIEFGIVIGVTAILGAAIIPDVIESTRNRAAEKAAADVSVIHESARLFFAQNPVRPRRWPGERNSGDCTVGWAPNDFRTDMVSGGYLAPIDPTQFMRNDWGHTLDVSLYAPPAAITPACLFSVSTFVPASVADSFISFLPQATCGPGCPNPLNTPAPPGFSRCCSFATKPGVTIVAACGTRPLVRNATTGELSCP